MRFRILQWASFLPGPALFYLWITGIIPFWPIIVLAAALFFTDIALRLRVYLLQPPSEERFRGLCIIGARFLVLTSMVAICLVMQFTEVLNPTLQGQVLGVLLLCLIAIGIGAFVWFHRALKNYDRNHKIDPDFAEDDDGNPERPKVEPH
jgi:hypothetical protein